jgi:hypothetical protein
MPVPEIELVEPLLGVVFDVAPEAPAPTVIV